MLIQNNQKKFSAITVQVAGDIFALVLFAHGDVIILQINVTKREEKRRDNEIIHMVKDSINFQHIILKKYTDCQIIYI